MNTSTSTYPRWDGMTVPTRETAPAWARRRGAASPLHKLTADDLADLRRMVESFAPRPMIDDLLSATILRCAEAAPGSKMAQALDLAANRGQALATFRNVARQTYTNQARRESVIDAAVRADGPTDREDRDDAFRWTRGAAAAADLATAGAAACGDAGAAAASGFRSRAGGTRRVGETTTPRAVRIPRETSLESMRERAAQMGHAPAGEGGQPWTPKGHRDDETRYGDRRQARYLLTAPTPILGGPIAAKIRAAVARSGRTFGALLYEHCDVTTPRERGKGKGKGKGAAPAVPPAGADDAAASRAPESREARKARAAADLAAKIAATDPEAPAIAPTREHSAIRWTDLARALDLEPSDQVRRALKAHATALATASMATDLRYRGASRATSLPFPGRTVARSGAPSAPSAR
jgi:hypothetical protein